MHGKFIVVEGLEGSGKTSIVEYIKCLLQKFKIKEVICTREPGSTILSEKLRNLIKLVPKVESISIYSELLIFYAARIQLIEKIIKPSLSKGIWIVGDRHNLSSKAYQGGGRHINENIFNFFDKNLLKDFKPDLTFYLDVSPEIGLSRITNSRKYLDNMECESIDFFKRVRAIYKKLSSKNNNIIFIDANKSFDLVKYNIRKSLIMWFKLL